MPEDSDARADPRDAAVSGIILAGGRSRRFGQDKCLAEIGGQPLLGHVVRALFPLVDEIIVVGRIQLPSLPFPVRLVGDAVPGLGPLQGLIGGLSAATHEWSIVVACDMPLLNGDLLRHIAACRYGYDAVVPHLDRPQPLYALYHRRCLPLLQQQLAAGDLRLTNILAGLHVRWIDEHDLRRFDPDLRSFGSINTPGEAAAAARFLGERANH
ncbi:MAG: molybdenum cofactor guanylyltransferase [Chloroflexi bacterium]|nr:molybdenum cofactor guanylyltransferase [Chloroflexota bacterium]